MLVAFRQLVNFVLEQMNAYLLGKENKQMKINMFFLFGH